MNNSPVKSELYVALENGRINLLLTSYQFIDIGKPFRIIGKICKDIERAFRFKGINVNFIVMMIDYIGFAFILKWNLHFWFTLVVKPKPRN